MALGHAAWQGHHRAQASCSLPKTQTYEHVVNSCKEPQLASVDALLRPQPVGILFIVAPCCCKAPNEGFLKVRLGVLEC